MLDSVYGRIQDAATLNAYGETGEHDVARADRNIDGVADWVMGLNEQGLPPNIDKAIIVSAIALADLQREGVLELTFDRN